jgi:hypothetical protein
MRRRQFGRSRAEAGQARGRISGPTSRGAVGVAVVWLRLK